MHLVTQARRPKSEDIAYRQRRYLVMMTIRAVCFGAAVLMFVNHLGWLAAIPVVGAIIIPYFAVVFANGGREPDSVRGFVEYHANLPAPRQSPHFDGQGPAGGAGSADGRESGPGGETGHGHAQSGSTDAQSPPDDGESPRSR